MGYLCDNNTRRKRRKKTKEKIQSALAERLRCNDPAKIALLGRIHERLDSGDAYYNS